MKTTKLFKAFLNSEKAGGIILIVCTVFSLLVSNSTFGAHYQHFWHTSFLGHSIEYWINDGLMTIFFLLIGLELEREIYHGELSNIKDAILPIFAAMGGMIVPAALFLSVNFNSETSSGAGIPMATDIAFALGILSLLGKRVPLSLKIFLTALAVIDDLGAILIIALFYTKTIVLSNLLTALFIFIVLLLCNRLKIKNLIVYLIGGIAMWYFMLNSGVHATITGVLLAFTIPFGNGNSKTASSILQNFLHIPVAYIILPLFALANTAIVIESNLEEIVSQNYNVGIILGLVIGKPLGIFLFSLLALKLGICKLPNHMSLKSVLGIGFLGGIGFTMSIFITLLAFKDETIINNAKFMILLSSLISGVLGYFILKKFTKSSNRLP